MHKVLKRLNDGDIVILDGAIGTELERRGIPETGDASWAECMDEYGTTVQAIHEDYIRAGAEILTTNTFSSGWIALEKLGRTDRFEEWNLKAVEQARKAMANVPGGEDCAIAGSASSFANGAMNLTSKDGTVSWAAGSSDRVAESFGRQAEVLAKAGVDLIVMEMLYAAPQDTRAALEAVRAAGLPIFLSLAGMIDPESGQPVLQAKDGHHAGGLPGAPFGASLAELDLTGVNCVLAMHSDISAVPALLDEIKAITSGPFGTYPNRTGYWNGGKWVFPEGLPPEDFAKLANGWVQQGARVIGGCCGIGPEHIDAVSKALKRV